MSTTDDLTAGSPLIDARMGIVRSIRHRALHPHLPQGIYHMVATLADATRFCQWPSDAVAGGCAWWDMVAARNAAIGEAVERYSGNLVPRGLRRASYAELAAAGEPALDPGQLVLFSEAQYKSTGFPFVPLTQQLPVLWAQGRDLATGERVLLPACLVYITYFRATPPTTEPMTNPALYAGIAAGRSREAAERAALLEVIERDAVTLGWLHGLPLPRIKVPDRLSALFSGPARVLETRLYQFPNGFGLPVIGALVRDVDTGILAMGTACRPHVLDALLKAFAEAAQLHLAAYELDDPESDLMRWAARSTDPPLKPWRADRRYRQSYRPDWRDVRDLICQLQLYLDPDMRAPLEERLAGGPEVELSHVAPGSEYITSLPACLEQLRRNGLRAIAVDLTTSDVRRLGWHVTRMIVPGVYSNTPAAFPLLGGQRLHASSFAFENATCLLPFPHA
ncbi:MAG: YcaO-like family protein [Egibacteraceae bacterium]